MSLDYSNISGSDSVKRGRKKVYSAKENLELILPNAKRDGVLEKGDLIFVVQKLKVNGKSSFRFMVVKFAQSPKQSTIYCCEEKYFEPHFDKQSSVEGEEQKTKSTNYVVPTITGLGGGALGYGIAKRFNKKKVVFSLVGLAIGIAVGIFILKYNNDKKQNK